MTTEQPTPDEVLQRIRSRGHWKVQLRPTVFNKKRINSLSKLDDAVRRARVYLRGWDYPHVVESDVTRHSDYIQGLTSWRHHHEMWRLFQSAQFVHIFSMTEDWLADIAPNQYGGVAPGDLLEPTSTLWTITEIFTFCGRLVEALELTEDLILSYTLVGLQKRSLQTLNPSRLLIWASGATAPDLTEYGEEIDVTAEQLIGSAAELAVEETLAVYERFHWQPDRSSVVEEQRKLLERRL